MTKKTASAPRKRGRPKLPAGVGKRHPLNMRTTKQIREGLETSAQKSGRSLAQEAEFRLERSFRQDETDVESWGGGAARELWRACAATANALGERCRRDWLSDPAAFQEARKSTMLLLDLLGADGPVHAKDLIGLGRMEVANTLRIIANEIDSRGLPEAESYDQESDPTVLIATRKILKQHLD